jgi:hypothetical protein
MVDVLMVSLLSLLSDHSFLISLTQKSQTGSQAAAATAPAVLASSESGLTPSFQLAAPAASFAGNTTSQHGESPSTSVTAIASADRSAEAALTATTQSVDRPEIADGTANSEPYMHVARAQHEVPIHSQANTMAAMQVDSVGDDYKSDDDEDESGDEDEELGATQESVHTNGLDARGIVDGTGAQGDADMGQDGENDADPDGDDDEGDEKEDHDDDDDDGEDADDGDEEDEEDPDRTLEDGEAFGTQESAGPAMDVGIAEETVGQADGDDDDDDACRVR